MNQVQRKRSRHPALVSLSAGGENHVDPGLLLQESNKIPDAGWISLSDIEQNRLSLAGYDDVRRIGRLLQPGFDQGIGRVHSDRVLGEAVVRSNDDVGAIVEPKCFDLRDRLRDTFIDLT